LTVFYLGVFAGSLFFSFVFTRYVRNVAMAHGWVTEPSSDRHVHRQPLPRLGGAAIFLAFVLTAGLVLLASRWLPTLQLDRSSKTWITILLPGVVIFLLGVYDDLRGAGPYLKFGVQAAAGSILFAGGLRILNMPVLFGDRHFSWFLGLPLTILWVLAITNAFNLIDGLDGLAAGSALFSTLVAFVVALVSGSAFVSLMTLALAGAILGFLRYNFNPATIFLGDSGSLFIGFMLSALALRGAQKAPTIIAVAIPVVSFGLPILETALSIVRRFISGRPVFTADREHIHHKLLQLGLSQRQAVIILYAVSALFALLSLFLLWPTGSTLGLVLVVLGAGVWMGVQRLNYLEFGELRRVALRTMEQRQIFINNLAIRRATEELKVVRNYEQLGRVLVAAFGNHDFDAFELRLRNAPPELPQVAGLQTTVLRTGESLIRWRKVSVLGVPEMLGSWKLTLDLVGSNGRRHGSMVLERLYSDRDLQFDINLLTSVFPMALADSLDRTVGPLFDRGATSASDSSLAAARVG
jgi:UDP-GlcNAc:undecaprenyl-phosphate/decaprenyl-phosphate GlcNAc-1-phosphate transferase